MINHGVVVAEGTPADIKARVGGKRIRFRAPALALDEAALRALPGVQRARRAGDVVELYSLRPEETLVRLLCGGAAALSDLEVVGAGLEEAFVAITRAEGAGA